MCVCECERVVWESVLPVDGMLRSAIFCFFSSFFCSLFFHFRFCAGGVLEVCSGVLESSIYCVSSSARFCAGGVLGCARGVLRCARGVLEVWSIRK